MSMDDKIRAMSEELKRNPQIQEEREKNETMLEKEMAKAGGRLVSPATKTQGIAPQAWPFPGANRASSGDIDPNKLKAAQHRAEIAQLGKPRYALGGQAAVAYAALTPFLGLIESAVREYSNTSRDLDEQLHARRALEVILAAQKVTP